MALIDKIAEKGSDKEKMARRLMSHPEEIGAVVEAMQAPTGTKRYACEKVLRLVSEQKPELMYSYFEVYVKLLEAENSFIKWGAILTIAHLTAVDEENQFEKIFKKYYAFITDPVMISAANVIGGSVRIAEAKPTLVEKITREILKVEDARYQKKGVYSPECGNVARGQAIESFEQFFDLIKDQRPVIAFVKRQLKNTRKAVVKKAEKFFKKYSIDYCTKQTSEGSGS